MQKSAKFKKEDHADACNIVNSFYGVETGHLNTEK